MLTGAGSVEVSALSQFAEDTFHFGNRFQLLVHLLDHPTRFTRRKAGKRGRHIEDGAFIRFGKKFSLEAVQQNARRESVSTGLPP